MNKSVSFIKGALCAIILFSYPAYAQNAFDYDTAKHAEHIGIYVMPFLNVNDFFVDGSGSTKGRNTLGFEGGVHYQYHLSKTLFLRGSIGFGVVNYGFKYNNKYAATSDTSFPKFADASKKVNNTIPYLKPQIMIGKEFAIKNTYFIEVGAGASFFYYLKRNDVVSDTINSSAMVKYVGNMDLEVYDSSYYGFRQQWGVLNAELYLGYHTRGFSDFFDRCGIGFSFSYTFYNNYSGYSDIVFYNKTFGYFQGQQNMKFGQAAIGLRLSYNIF